MGKRLRQVVQPEFKQPTKTHIVGEMLPIEDIDGKRIA